ncbi:MAG TPA: serine/threonine protein kinase, partial [Myxococcales bacterium]|nr:serine/threonine protein kinase [Myxococcales bacterium]
AHARGIVHRDLKPENVLVSPREGRALPDVKVVDFGLAKEGALGARVDISLRGEILGTPRYMSPEQLCGVSVDARADVYALGLMTYEMLTGESPYRPARGVAGWADRHLFDDPTPIDAHPVSRALSGEARRTIMRALAKSRENRVDRAGELAACLDAHPVVTRLPRPRRRAVSTEGPARGPRWPTILAAALVAAVLLIGGVLASRDAQSVTRREPAPPALRDS